ncbi:BppU family phage baseplate upper protein [Limosilactobacillus pontis]|uniref:BppU family phage baseplate upper protein n=1 Tax=Limosilactobacillus pontis TaxID=35787 RepID=A0ABT7UVD9_9LACO|nr:BppU family phage baseplate upper protein [Limosilactobacillus pontis]MDM8265671.1 BppU family phage baseplate upper protein [Limosilactobacillus pontis]
MQTLTYTIGKDRRALVKDIQNFTIDFNDQGVNNWVQARQYERSMRQVFVNVKNEDDSSFDLTGCNVWFEGVLPDKTHKILDAKHAVILDAQNGQFRFDMPAQAFAVAGSYVQAFFRIVRDGQSITTLEFDLEVLADKVISGLIPSDYITPFDDLYDQLEQIVNNADGKLQDKLTEWNQKLQNLFDTLNKMGTDTQTLLQTLQNRIAELEEKIKQDGLFTQAEADTFKQTITNQVKALTDQLTNSLGQKIDAAVAEVKSYGLTTTNIRKQISYNGYWSNLDQSHSGGVYTSSLDSIKNEIDQMAPLVDGVTLLFHQYITGGKLVVLEDLDTFKQAIDYAKSKGLIIAGYKFHCTTSIDDIKSYGVSEFFADYKANVDEVTSTLPEAGVPLILFNERGDLYGATSPYAGNVRSVMQDLVSATFKVDISFQSLQDFISADPHVQDIVDAIMINSYERISDKNFETTLPDVITGIDGNFYNLALYIHSLYPHKPLVMSEFGIKNNWAAFDEPWSWEFSSVYDDPAGTVSYLYLRGLMQSETIKLFDGVWLWFYADLLQSEAGKDYLRAYKKGVI